MTKIFSCLSCGWWVKVTAMQPTTTAPCICGQCGGRKFSVEEVKAA